MDVPVRIDQFRRAGGGRVDGGVREPVALEDFLRAREPHGSGSGAGGGERRRRAALSIADEHGRDANDGEITVAAAELLEGEAGAGGHGRQADLDEDVLRTEA